jgi:Arc/MetJ family transcription regulator
MGNKTLIDIDNELLTRSQEILGTTTKKDTVNAALREVVRLRAVQDLTELGKAGIYDELMDAQVAERAWRR